VQVSGGDAGALQQALSLLAFHEQRGATLLRLPRRRRRGARRV
jgi:hypothetical protein